MDVAAIRVDKYARELNAFYDQVAKKHSLSPATQGDNHSITEHMTVKLGKTTLNFTGQLIRADCLDPLKVRFLNVLFF